ncbi:unnamed protein product, partial [Mycena citricolor]
MPDNRASAPAAFSYMTHVTKLLDPRIDCPIPCNRSQILDGEAASDILKVLHRKRSVVAGVSGMAGEERRRGFRAPSRLSDALRCGTQGRMLARDSPLGPSHLTSLHISDVISPALQHRPPRAYMLTQIRTDKLDLPVAARLHLESRIVVHLLVAELKPV